MALETTHRYDDIIMMPHYRSYTRPHMPARDRAAQFMPFAALAGYDEIIERTARRVERAYADDASGNVASDPCASGDVAPDHVAFGDDPSDGVAPGKVAPGDFVFDDAVPKGDEPRGNAPERNVSERDEPSGRGLDGAVPEDPGRVDGRCDASHRGQPRAADAGAATLEG